MKRGILYIIVFLILIGTAGCGNYQDELVANEDNLSKLSIGEKLEEENIVEQKSNEKTMQNKKEDVNISSKNNKDSNIPSYDEDSANQIAEKYNDINLSEKNIIIRIEEVTNRKIKLYIENMCNEGISIGKISIEKYLNNQNIELQSNDMTQSALPDLGIVPGGNTEIEFDFETVYGKLEVGKYVCIVKINGIKIYKDFEIE